MEETKIKWNEGDGYITATYEGSGNGSASISSDVNEGIDREQSITIETTKGNNPKSESVVVTQIGRREIFLPGDGDFILADGGTFNVLKNKDDKPDYSTWRGVYIQDIDGYLHSESEWDSSKTPNGIAVLTDECQFVVALESYSYKYWSNTSFEMANVETFYNKTDAIYDYNGLENTSSIISQLSVAKEDDYAAFVCNEYVFPNGKNGYLGAAGEWYQIGVNLDVINNMLNLLGRESIDFSAWTSTQRNASNSWQFRQGSSNYIFANSKTSTARAMAFTTI